MALYSVPSSFRNDRQEIVVSNFLIAVSDQTPIKYEITDELSVVLSSTGIRRELQENQELFDYLYENLTGAWWTEKQLIELIRRKHAAKIGRSS